MEYARPIVDGKVDWTFTHAIGALVSHRPPRADQQRGGPYAPAVFQVIGRMLVETSPTDVVEEYWVRGAVDCQHRLMFMAFELEPVTS